jgi:flagellar biogenesis protein FliO
MEWTQQLLGVGLVLGLLGASLFWLRRRGLARPAIAAGRRGRARSIELLDRVALTPQHSVHLVRMGDRMILVGRAPSGLTRLASAPWKEPEAAQ